MQLLPELMILAFKKLSLLIIYENRIEQSHVVVDHALPTALLTSITQQPSPTFIQYTQSRFRGGRNVSRDGRVWTNQGKSQYQILAILHHDASFAIHHRQLVQHHQITPPLFPTLSNHPSFLHIFVALVTLGLNHDNV